MTRARAIEEALRELLSAREFGEYTGAVDAARAALSLPADAPPDEYRRGVEDAAKWLTEKGFKGTEVLVYALAPPAPSSAATKEEK